MGVDTPAANDGHPVQAIRLGTTQDIALNAAGGAAVQLPSAFGQITELIMVSSKINVRIAIGATPTATATSTLLPGPFIQYFRVFPGWNVSALSDDTTTGHLSVTECSMTG